MENENMIDPAIAKLDEKLAELDHDDWSRDNTDHEVLIERLDNLDERLRGIENRQTEFTDLAKKIWGFVDQMKDNPMLSAMLGGIPKK